MNKANFVKHMEALTRANDSLDAMFDAMGGEFDNGLTRLLDEVPVIYAEVYGVTQEQWDLYMDIVWQVVMHGEFHYEDIHITNWEEFYDYFFVK